MSYPQRPPMGMPPMMGPQGYGYPPMGMMPMGMGMMPMMRPHMNNSNNADKKNKLVPQEIPQKDEKKEEKAPVTTVFVGNISDRAPDPMIRQMLQRCGNVLSWKRVQGASGKLQAFGFCEYESPEATLRAIRLLHNWMIPDKRLVVKVDAKTKSLLDDWGRKKKKKDAGEDDKKKEDGEIDEDKDNAALDELDEFTLREDRVAKAGLDAIMREYASDIEREMPPGEEEASKVEMKPKRTKEKLSDGPKDAVSKRNLGLEDMELEEEKKEIINREIRSFRDAYKDDEDDDDKSQQSVGGGGGGGGGLGSGGLGSNNNDRNDATRRRRDHDREQERRQVRERERHERDVRGEREREREREREQRDRERRERTVSSMRSRSRSREARTVPPPSTRLIPDHRDAIDEEEEHERRKLERKLRDKQIAYQDLLKKWEARERKKAREYEKDQEREDERKTEETKEARRLKEFLEDYDDERDDPKYYKSGALQRRLKEREKEMEADDRDRQREKEEIEETRNKLQEEGHSDLEERMAQLEKDRDAHLMPQLNKSPTPESSSPSSPEPEPEKRKQPIGFHGVIPPPAAAAESDEDDGKTGIIIPPHPVGAPPRAPPNHDSDSSNDAQMDNGRGYDDDDDDDNDDADSRRSSPPRDRDRERSMSMSQSSSHFYNNGQSQQSLTQQQSVDEVMQTVNRGFHGVGGPAGPPADIGSPEPSAPAQKRKKLTREEVFNMDDDEDSNDGVHKKRKLVPLDYTEVDRSNKHGGGAAAAAAAAAAILKPTTAEEKRKCIKNLIERIPTAKEQLFGYQLDWSMVDPTLMDRRIRPWVNKKIVEYIGEEEPTLSDFICQKVMGHCMPHTILSDIAMVLDEEAEVFVVKMWRLLIYETEAKKLGLVK